MVCFNIVFLLLSIMFYLPIQSQDEGYDDNAYYDESSYTDESENGTQDYNNDNASAMNNQMLPEPEKSPIEAGDGPQEAPARTPAYVNNMPVMNNQAVNNVVPQPTEHAIVDSMMQESLGEPEGIHTVDINEPEGNWLFKRIWWEKSKDLFGKIREYVDKIVESRMHFFEERVKLDRGYLDPFYVEVGLDQGGLTEMTNHLIGLLKAERADQGALGSHELEQYNLLLEEKAKVEKLRFAVADVQKLSAGLDDALKNLMDQINRTRSYERQAWQLLNEIAEELSDKKAREHYYEIATLWRNVKDIGNYIVGPFSSHFIELGTTLVDRIKEIRGTLATFKEKGIELHKQVEDELESSCKHHQDDESDEEYVPKVGWISWFFQKITAPFRFIWRTVTGLFGR